jgi:hypothetical protein
MSSRSRTFTRTGARDARRPSSRAGRALAPWLAGLWLAGAGAVAAPVDHDSGVGGPDPYELAARWTMASLPASMGGAGAPLAALQAPPAAALDRPPAVPGGLRFTALPMAGGAAGVPDPGSYALMGLLLLAAGLVVHQLRRGRAAAQRGLSKKT